MPNERDAELDQLRQELDTIMSRLRELAFIDEVTFTLVAVLDANQEVRPQGTLRNWMARCYSYAVLAGLRALNDRTRGVASLAKFLDHAAGAAPRLFTRERYVSFFSDESDEGPERSIGARHGNEAFDRIVGAGCSTLTRAQVDDDRQRLSAALEHLEAFANEHYLHINPTPTAPAPTFQDARDAIRVVHAICRRYLLLLSGAQSDTIVPHTERWVNAFRMPWLKPGEDVPRHVSLDDLGGASMRGGGSA